MAFTPLNIPIQEILVTDFITDISQISNSNFLLLEDKLEDLINNFEIDLTGISIGTDTAINSIKTIDLVLQNSGFTFQTGTPTAIIARLSKNGSDKSLLNIDNLTVDEATTMDSLTVNDITIADSATINGATIFASSLQYNASLIESKETVSVTLEFDTVNKATGNLTLTSTSDRNIYVTLEAETAVGATQVYNGTIINTSIADLELIVDFDAINPPAANTVFTIHIVDIVENSGFASIITKVNAGSIPTAIIAGTNNATTNTILMHHDLVAEGQKLSVNYTSGAMFETEAIKAYGSNATFQYIIDKDLNDRLIIKSAIGLEIN